MGTKRRRCRRLVVRAAARAQGRRTHPTGRYDGWFRCLRLPARLLVDAPDRAVHLVEGAIDVADAPVKVAAINLNRGAAFRARHRRTTQQPADGACDGGAAVAIEVDLLSVEIESAHRRSRGHGVDDVELAAVVYAIPVLVSRLTLVPNLLTDRHAGTGLPVAAPARDPRRRVDVGELVQRIVSGCSRRT